MLVAVHYLRQKSLRLGRQCSAYIDGRNCILFGIREFQQFLT